MAFAIKIIIATVIVFFLWNILKKIFFNKFYNYFNQNIPKSKVDRAENTTVNHKVNWDAETVEYEEVKEDKYEKK